MSHAGQVLRPKHLEVLLSVAWTLLESRLVVRFFLLVRKQSTLTLTLEVHVTNQLAEHEAAHPIRRFRNGATLDLGQCSCQSSSHLRAIPDHTFFCFIFEAQNLAFLCSPASQHRTND